MKNAKAKTSDENTAPTSAKRTVEVDQFGSRTSSQAALINRQLNSKPASVEDIGKATALSAGRIRSHLKYLVNRKLAVQREDGWVITK